MKNWAATIDSFDQDGLTIIFSAYELAAYAAGHQEFHFYLQCAGQLLERQRPYRAWPERKPEFCFREGFFKIAASAPGSGWSPGFFR